MSSLNLKQLINEIERHSDAPLIFLFDGSQISPGYHITEVKHAAVKSLDCGRGTDQWEEVVIQLFDGSNTSTQGHMVAGKFSRIVASAVDSLSLDQDSELYFEFSPNNEPVRKLSAISLCITSEGLNVFLEGASAICKPYQRAKVFDLLGSASSGCCGSK